MANPELSLLAASQVDLMWVTRTERLYQAVIRVISVWAAQIGVRFSGKGENASLLHSV
jgi:hypothetical protein